MWKSLFSVGKKGFKAVATGNAQAQLGVQSPHVPGMLVRLGRFFYLTGATWLLATWYTGYANARTEAGSGPQLVMPGRPKIASVDRPLPAAKWAKLQGGGTTAPGGSQGGLPGFFPGSGKAGGFLPKNATYKPGRADQGRDGQTDPGGPIIAPGSGQVLRILSDPNGFGPNYPVVKFSSGPYSGRILYIGHTHTALQAGQSFRPGQVLSYTGKGPGGVGNASTPGWFEIGFADSGYPGRMGQPTPFS